MRVHLDFWTRAAEHGIDLWVMAMREDGEHESHLALLSEAYVRATIPALREVVEREVEEGDTDGLSPDCRAMLDVLERLLDDLKRFKQRPEVRYEEDD